LGIDAGTGSVKCVAAAMDGAALWTSSVRYEYQSPHPGWAEQEPQTWWQATTLAIRKLLAEHPELCDGIQAIGVCGQGAAAVLLDANYQPTRPAILWLDSRSAAEAQRMAKTAGSEIAQSSGKSPAAYNVEPKLRWVASHEPEVWKRTGKCMTTTAYVTYQLCGTPVMNHSDAGILLSYDLRQRRWSERLCGLMNLCPDLYCPIVECDEVVGGLTAGAASETGLRAGIPVIAGGEDTSAAALAAGVVSADLGILSLGTAGTIYTPSLSAATHPRLLSFPHVLKEQTLVGGSTVCGGSGLEWIARLVGRDSASAAAMENLCQEAAATVTGESRVVFLPYLSGELQPINDGFARGVFFGADFATSGLDMVAAVMQGSAFAFAHNLEITRQITGGPCTLIATGRPAQNKAFMQTICDATGLPIRVLADGGGAALGAAILASTALCPKRSAVEMARRHSTMTYECAPQEKRRERLRELFAIYKELYCRLEDLFPRLSAEAC
jgi:xylulokinase